MAERMKTSFLFSVVLLAVCMTLGAFLPAEPSAATEAQECKADYIFNKNTKKFHYTDCESVKRMNEKNKGYYIGTREELLLQGFAPCRNCYP